MGQHSDVALANYQKGQVIDEAGVGTHLVPGGVPTPSITLPEEGGILP